MQSVSSRVFFMMSVVCGTSLACVAGCSSPSQAVGAATPTSARGVAPPPSPEAARIAALFDGEWKGTARMTMEGKTTPLDLTVRCAGTSAGWGTSCLVTCVDPAGGRHEETHLFGYSADGAKVHLFTVTTDGDTHDHAGTFTDKGVSLQYRGTAGDKPLVETVTFERGESATLHFHNDTTVGGAAFVTVDADLQR